MKCIRFNGFLYVASFLAFAHTSESFTHGMTEDDNLISASVSNFPYYAQTNRNKTREYSDFQVFSQIVTVTTNLVTTKYSALNNSSFEILRKDADEAGKTLVIIEDFPYVHSGYRNVTSYLVLRKIVTSENLFSAHIAHVRKGMHHKRGVKFVEWEPFRLVGTDDYDGIIGALIPPSYSISTYNSAKIYIPKRGGEFPGDANQAQTQQVNQQEERVKASTNVTDNNSDAPCFDDVPSFVYSGSYEPLEITNGIFAGLGNCSYQPVTRNWKHPLGLVEGVFRVATILRVQCKKRYVKNLMNLFQTGFITLSMEGRVELDGNHTWEVQKVFSNNGWIKFSSAVLLHALSHAYAEQEEKYRNKLPLLHAGKQGAIFSISCETMTKFVINVAQAVQKRYPFHAVKFSNILRGVLANYRSRLLQDNLLLRDCDSCKMEKILNYADQTRAIALLRFFVYSMNRIAVAPDIDVSAAFHKFLKGHAKRHELMVEGRIPVRTITKPNLMAKYHF